MRNIVNYVIARIAATYLALAPVTAEATSGYEYKFKSYKTQIRAEDLQENILPDAIFVKAVPLQRKPIPLELIIGIPTMEEIKATPEPPKLSFFPTPKRLKEMEKRSHARK